MDKENHYVFQEGNFVEQLGKLSLILLGRCVSRAASFYEKGNIKKYEHLLRKYKTYKSLAKASEQDISKYPENLRELIEPQKRRIW